MRAPEPRPAMVPEWNGGVRQGATPRSTRVGNLPWATTTFVDRPERRELIRLLEDPAARLVTLVGPHGSGKTRLALSAAAAVASSFADGVWYVDVADAPAEAIAVLIAATLQPASAASTASALAANLQSRHALVLLDTTDTALAAGPLLAMLLAAAPGVRMLATSRVPFGVAAERRFHVPPLAVPTMASVHEPTELGRVPAVALFGERAKAVDPSWMLTAANAAAVAALCVRLDGLPLAIELATAWLRVLPVEALLARFPSTLDLLDTGGPDRPARHRTLRAAIAWGERRLTSDERTLMRCLAVCRDGSTLEALEALSGLPAERVSRATEGLILKSLGTMRREVDGSARYGLLGSVAEYAEEQLLADGQLWRLRRDHAAYYAGLSERVAGQLATGGTPLSRDTRERDGPNLRAVLDWMTRERDPTAADPGRRRGGTSSRPAWIPRLVPLAQPERRGHILAQDSESSQRPVPMGSIAVVPWAHRGPTVHGVRAVHNGYPGEPGVRSGGGLLSRRELDVVRLIGQGCTNREVAATLCLTPRTVENHVHRILAKVRVGSRTALAVWAYRVGLTPDVPAPRADHQMEPTTAAPSGVRPH